MEKKLIASLIKARKNFKPLRFDKQGARNKYASFGAISDAVQEALNEQGIEMLVSTYRQEGVNMACLKLKHSETDETQMAEQPLIDDPNSQIKDANQRYGAALTYAMRNLARALLCLHADEDDLDDYGSQPSAKRITDKQLALLKRIMPGEYEEPLLKKYNIGNLSELTMDQASMLIGKFKDD